jgi:hypothetical protein
VGHEKWGKIQLKRSKILHHGPGLRKSRATVGKDLEESPMAKNQMFEWLVLHNRIITWENLMKRGFIVRSLCHLSQVKEETIDHLLDECNYTAEIWDWVACIYRQSNRVRGEINATIKD